MRSLALCWASAANDLLLWMQSTGGYKVSKPLPPKVMASVAAVTQSQASQLALVSRESDLPSSELDSSAQEMIPVSDLVSFPQGMCCCV